MVIRRAEPDDLPAVARLAADLIRMHHGFDPRRFMLLEPLEEGYRWWLGQELGRPEAFVLVAVDVDRIVGYAYAALEPRNWAEMLDACGKLHDVYVTPAARRGGLARRLVEAALAALAAAGARQVVLTAAAVNGEAQAFFATLGFRPTMVEMTRELGPGGAPGPGPEA